jgi:hypothetical protein
MEPVTVVTSAGITGVIGSNACSFRIGVICGAVQADAITKLNKTKLIGLR